MRDRAEGWPSLFIPFVFQPLVIANDEKHLFEIKNDLDEINSGPSFQEIDGRPACLERQDPT